MNQNNLLIETVVRNHQRRLHGNEYRRWETAPEWLRSILIETKTCKLFGEWQNSPAPRDILANGRLWKVMLNAAPSLT